MNAPAPGWPLGPHDPVSLGRYELLRRLGQGGMGTVYLGRTDSGRLVAVKVIRPEFAQVAEFRSRFRLESENARRVARFCTAEVLDADPEGDKPYLVTEFVEGATLAHVVAENGPLSSADLERLAVGVAAALTAIHGAGVVHRDLKPGNVMLSPFGPRVIDFGIARASEAASAVTQIQVGTPAFMAPEQVLGEPLTPSIDVFAWGAVVAFAGSGILPFGSDPTTLFRRILTAPPDLAGLRDHAFLAPLVEQALSKDPAARPAANDLLMRLLGAGGAAPLSDPRAAVSEALDGWEAPTTTLSLGPVAAAPTAATPDGVPTAVVEPTATPDVGRALVDPPTAATVAPRPAAAHPAASDPAASSPAAPPVSAAGPPVATPERVPVAPPARDEPGPSGPTPPGPSGPGDPHEPARPARRRRVAVLAVVALVVVAAVVVVVAVTLLSGGGDGRPVAQGSGTPAASSASASPTVSGTPLPRSTALGTDTMVVERGEGAARVLVALTSDGTASPISATAPQERASLSPDRRTVASWRRSDNSLWLSAVDGTGSRPLLVGDAGRTLSSMPGDRVAWSPDGSQVAAYLSGPDGLALYVVDPVTGAFRKLPTPQRLGDPAWSPTGDRIAYWAADAGFGGPVYTVAADGSAPPQQVTHGTDAEPAWSPDGTRLAVRRVDGSGRSDVVTLAASGDGDGSEVTELTAGRGDNTGPSWSPTGDRLAFVSDRSGTALVYVTDPSAAGGTATPVPGQSEPTGLPSWSSGRRTG